MNKFSKGAICLSVALACAWGAKAQNVELTPDFCNAVKHTMWYKLSTTVWLPC